MRDFINIVENVLEEGRDSPLFHFTPNATLTAILIDDALVRGHVKDNDGKTSISLTRSLYTPFAHKMRAVLILNQTKIAQNYKIVPVYGDSPKFMQAPQNEFEERVFENIEPLHKYLLGIAVDINPEHMLPLTYFSHSLAFVYSVGTYAKKYGVPIVFRNSLKPNGTWSKDITKEVIKLSDMIEEKFPDKVMNAHA